MIVQDGDMKLTLPLWDTEPVGRKQVHVIVEEVQHHHPEKNGVTAVIIEKFGNILNDHTMGFCLISAQE